MTHAAALPLLPTAYAALTPAGRGAFGLVWRARHARFGEVAVKVLAPEQAHDPEAAWRFGAEFRLLQLLGAAQVPAAFEQGLTGDGLPYFAMAFVPGEHPQGPLPAAQVRGVVTAIATALGALHAAGYVHGDLTDGNVLLAPDGRAVLLDLALARPIGAAREGFSGTPTHLAPEAWRGAPADPAQDWYALGVLGHRLWTGALPFTGDGADLVRAHVTAPPPALSAAKDDADLAAALETMLAKRPAEREAALASLGVVTRPLGLLRAAELPPPDDDMSAWTNALATGGLVRLVGPPGSGKSRTLDRWRLEALAAGRRWVAVAADAAVAGATLRSLVARALAGHQAPCHPAVADWLAGRVPADWAELEPRARQARLADAVAGALAASDPAVWVVDGFDEADEASRSLILALDGHPALPGACWVVTTLQAPADQVACVALSPWSDLDLTELAEAQLGGPLPDELATWLSGYAWPGQLTQALARWQSSGALRHGADGWHFDPAHQAMGVALPECGTALAEAIALATGAGGLPLAALPHLGLPDWAHDLDSLTRTGLAELRGGLVRLAAREAAAGLVNGLTPARRAALAGELAAAVARVGGPDAIAGRLAVSAGDAEAAWPLLTSAARAALDDFDPAAALALVALAPPGAGPAARLTLAWVGGEAARLANQLDEALTGYDAAIPLADAAGDAVLAARCRIGRAKVHQMRARYDEAATDARAAEAIGSDAPLVAARAAVALARIRYFQGVAPDALAACARGVDRAREAGAQAGAGAVLSAALNLEGALMAETTPERGAEALVRLDEALALARAEGDRLALGAALENLGNTHLALGNLPEAREAFSCYETLCRENRAPTEGLSAGMNRALALAALGDPAAVALARETATSALALQRPFIASLARLALGEVSWRLGDWAGAGGAFDEALTLAQRAGNRYAETLVRLARLEWASALGLESHLADELAATGLLLEASAGLDARGGVALARARQALLNEDPASAAAHAGPYADCASLALRRRARMVLGQAALAAGDQAAAHPHFEAAEAIAAGWQSRWHLEDAWLGLARAAGPAREETWLARILEREAPAGHPIARAAAAAMRLEAGRALGASGLAALEGWRSAISSLEPPVATALRLAWKVPQGASAVSVGGAIEPGAVGPWLAAIGLAQSEDAVLEALLAAVMALAVMQRGYMLGYAHGRLTQVATRHLDFAAELADGLSMTIADEAMITGEPIYVVDAQGAGRFAGSASVVALGLRTVLALPVTTATQILGVVYVDRPHVEPLLAPVDLALLGALATCAASQLTCLSATLEAREAARWGEAVGAIARASAASPDDRHRVALEGLVATADGRGGSWLVDHGDDWSEALVVGECPPVPAAVAASVAARPPGMVLTDDSGAWIMVVAVPGRREAVVIYAPVAEAQVVSAAIAPLSAALGALAPWLGALPQGQDHGG